MQTGDQEHANGNIPPMPVSNSSEISTTIRVWPVDGSRYRIGWKCWPFGPRFAVVRITMLGTKVVSKHYPVTKEGWLGAWRAFAAIDPAGAERLRRLQGNRWWRRDAESSELALLSASTFLGGYTKCATLVAHSSYDLRFADDRLEILRPGKLRPLGQLPYDDFVDLQMLGPGLVKSANPFIGPAGTIMGAAIRVAQPGINENILKVADGAISAALKTAGTRSEIRTVLYIRTGDSELFFLNTRSEPDQLRIDLSPAVGRIRELLQSSVVTGPGSQNLDASSVISQLKDASELLARDLITRDEFDQLKSRLIDGE
jgi:hypothetical protein